MPDDDGTTTSRWWSWYTTRIPASARAPVLSAIGLMLLGLVLWQTEGMSALIGVWVCGILVLIPGVYVSRIAYYAYKGVEGYTWADIPDVFRQ
ncbi:Transmembrane protein 230 [Picochlorum sp. SENEW3]|nr:Transmembrane protein 230 [Picochlorum sp. SENEW3]WPT14738.1 Transmembrane protein 230 [Picochlorum sp. SENEW3]